MELTFTREDVPKISRAGGSGREPEKWEENLAPLKGEDHKGLSHRVWDYDKRSSAISRMSSVRDRLNKAVPHENWTLAVRQMVDSERFGVYVTYNGVFTPEQIQENARKHQERSERVRSSRAKAAANGSATEASVDDSPTEPSAKERVAAARKAAK